MKIIDCINSFVVDDIIPDLTFFLDVDSQVGLQRATIFNKNLELRFEDEFLQKKEVDGKLFLERVRDGYYQIARQNPDRIKIIDANRDISLLTKDIIEVLNLKLSQKYKKEIILKLHN